MTHQIDMRMLKGFVCIYRRNFEIFLLICTMGIACVLLTHHVRSAIKDVGYDRQLNMAQAAAPQQTSTPDPRQIRNGYLKSMLNCYDHPLQMEQMQYGHYWLLKNLIRGRLSANMGCAESITYTTNGDYTFMDNLAEVVTRWMGPVSIALFAPGHDFNATMDSIQYARNCLPHSFLIREYVTFHIYFPNDHMPPQRVPLNEEEALEWPYDCQLEEAPYEHVDRSSMYKTQKNLTYPINVGRNIARKAANTYFIFPCDIELYPSRGVIEQFLNMAYENITLVSPSYDGSKLRVYVLPVFELQAKAKIPNNKKELVPMLRNKQAIAFHYRVCKNCHVVPDQDKWINATYSDDLVVFTVAKRQKKYVYWEPFYISDNREPLFDERVTWEGQSNKRIQNYAMCLLDYEYHVLHPAFLVHSPGIKKFDPKSERQKYVRPMNKFIEKKIKPEYAVLYGTNKGCRV
ncbi:beta-1,4-glucuronyltransferase 1-like [Musca autumnalis]|uniref:beta-1,4-glucuronyltransferase 1-like n=1 Tax=Musca autumnalis TaxID=221902 RepID=UPI003CE745B4